ncbi:MAG: ABC transporter permease [Eubacteriales bacterium]|nr:ABC transporter permease [Eubacteriales bacterium]
MKRFLTFEKRSAGTSAGVFVMRVLAIAFAVLITALLLLAVGKTPAKTGSILYCLFIQPFFSDYGIADTFKSAIPLIILSIGVGLAFKVKLWNIGAEGQMAVGAMAAAAIPIYFPNMSGVPMILLMATVSIVAGMVWGAIAGIPKAYLGANETITTLMLNYVALKLVQALVLGPWRDPNGKGFPVAPLLPKQGWLATFGSSGIHLGILLALALVVIYWFVMSRNRWGYEIRVTGESAKAAQYAGINVKRNMVLVLLISGAICGLGGMVELTGRAHRLDANLTNGMGFTAVIIAWLSKLNPFGIVVMSLFMAGLTNGGGYAQTEGIPGAIATMIQGILLFSVLGFDILTRYKIYIGGKVIDLEAMGISVKQGVSKLFKGGKKHGS